MDASYRHCEQLVRTADKDRYLTALFAPADRRGALFALYAFNAEVASIRDRVREPMAGEIRLQWWRDVLNGERGGEAAANPVAAGLLDAITRCGLSVDALLELIEAHAFDLYDDPMPTLGALEGYAHKTVAALFGQAVRVCAASADGPAGADGPAANAGVAWGIADMLRAFARHVSRRQLFVPQALLAHHGARAEDVLAGRTTPALLAALAALRGEARRRLAAFEAQMSFVPVAALPAFLPAALIPGYLAAMDRPGYDPFMTAVDVPQWRRQWTLWRAAQRYADGMRG